METLLPTPDILRSHARRLRSYYQRGLVLWLRGEEERRGLRLMRSALAGLEEVFSDAALAGLWWVAGEFLSALGARDGTPKDSVRPLLAQLDMSIKRLAETEPPRDVVPSAELLQGLLRWVSGTQQSDDPMHFVSELLDGTRAYCEANEGGRGPSDERCSGVGSGVDSDVADAPGGGEREDSPLPSRVSRSLKAAQASLSRLERESGAGNRPPEKPTAQIDRSLWFLPDGARAVSLPARTKEPGGRASPVSSSGSGHSPTSKRPGPAASTNRSSEGETLADLAGCARELGVAQSRMTRQVGSAKAGVAALDRAVARLRSQWRQLEMQVVDLEPEAFSPGDAPLGQAGGALEPKALGMQTVSRRIAGDVEELASIRDHLADVTRVSEGVLSEHGQLNRALRTSLRRSVPEVSVPSPEAVLLVRLEADTLAVPVTYVDGVLSVSAEESTSLEARGSHFHLPTQAVYSLAHLGHLLGSEVVARPQDGPGRRPLVLLRDGGKCLAVWVDGVAGRDEVVVEPVGPPLDGLPWLRGAVVTSDNRTVAVLDVSVLLAER